MSRQISPIPLLMGTVLTIWCGAALAADQPPQTTANAAATKAAATDAELIASAESAAPPSLSKHATIMAPDASGKMRTLRKGTNNFTCMPDDPATPGADPTCADAAAMEWLHAYLAHTNPTSGKVGFMYMLAGGSDASNTDPYATKPADGRWIQTGPHVMVVGADASFYDAYPKGANPDTSVFDVMWAGMPYQHLMAPVRTAGHAAPTKKEAIKEAPQNATK